LSASASKRYVRPVKNAASNGFPASIISITACASVAEKYPAAGTNSTDEINEPTIKVLPYFHQGAKRKQMLPQPCLSFPTVFSGINLLSVIVVGFILT